MANVCPVDISYRDTQAKTMIATMATITHVALLFIPRLPIQRHRISVATMDKGARCRGPGPNLLAGARPKREQMCPTFFGAGDGGTQAADFLNEINGAQRELEATSGIEPEYTDLQSAA